MAIRHLGLTHLLAAEAGDAMPPVRLAGKLRTREVPFCGGLA
jgi:hypothetical protein